MVIDDQFQSCKSLEKIFKEMAAAKIKQNWKFVVSLTLQKMIEMCVYTVLDTKLNDVYFFRMLHDIGIHILSINFMKINSLWYMTSENS